MRAVTVRRPRTLVAHDAQLRLIGLPSRAEPSLCSQGIVSLLQQRTGGLICLAVLLLSRKRHLGRRHPFLGIAMRSLALPLCVNTVIVPACRLDRIPAASAGGSVQLARLVYATCTCRRLVDGSFPILGRACVHDGLVRAARADQRRLMSCRWPFQLFPGGCCDTAKQHGRLRSGVLC